MGSRAQIEQLLVSRQAKRMVFVGLAITYAGANADLNDSIGYAVRTLGGTTANPVSVADTDIDPVLADAEAGLDAILDVAELRLLRTIKGNLDAVDITSGPFTEKYSQFGNGLDKDIDRAEKQVQQWGVDPVQVEAGVVTLNIMQHGDDPLPIT